MAEKISKKRKNYGIKVQEQPMTTKEQISFYIKNGISFMLHGISGVGKTRRIEEADPDFTSIVLRNGILPEEIIGKTIYRNGEDVKGGEWAPPAWYVSLCEKCEKEPDKNHVLFIDELTNVKPNEQSLVYHLVLNNSIGPNVGELPKNVVVVSAGNSKEESEAAYNMPEPLFRRFDGHIYLEPNIEEWLEWASEETEQGNPKVHPIVSAFVATYSDKVFYTKYDSEEPPKYAIDPRGWEQISDIIYANEGVIALELIANKVGEDVASTFVAFAKNPPLTLDEILEKNYTYSDIPTSFDARLAMAMSLRQADEEEIEEVRDFVSEELGSEILATFDSIWVGQDNERAILIKELEEEKSKNPTAKAKASLAKKYKITIDEFFEGGEKAIHCDEEWKAKQLCEAFHKMGRKWIDGSSYMDCKWYSGDQYYNNLGQHGEFDDFTNNPIYNFDEVDISKYVEQTSSKKITLDEFFEGGDLKAIHCDEEWKAKQLCSAFSKMGKTWRTGDSYKADLYFADESNTCYDNHGEHGYRDWYVNKKVPVYNFDEVDISKYIEQTSSKKITLDEFFKGEVKAIHCDEEWKAKQLCEAFHKMGKIWKGGDSYEKLVGYNWFGDKTCYRSDGMFSSKETSLKNKIQVYEFDEVDISKYIEQTSSKKITIDEFFEGEEKAIHCDEEWKAKQLHKAFGKMGKTWCTGRLYQPDDTRYFQYGSETCYTNRGKYGPKDYQIQCKNPVYDFNEIDLSKYLTKEEMSRSYYESSQTK